MAAHPSSPEVALQRRFLLLSVIVVSLLFAWMIRAFLMALLVAALASAILRPVYRWLTGALGGRPVLASVLMVVGTLLLVVGPLTTFLGLVVGQAVEITQSVTPWVEENLRNPEQLRSQLERIPGFDRVETLLPEREKLVGAVSEVIRSTGGILINGVAAAGKLTARFFLQLFIFLYAMFFFLLQGKEILERILYYAPLDRDDEEELVGRFVSVTKATLKGSLVIGGLQGLLAGLAFWAAGIQGAAFWGTVMMVLSVIPGLGAPLIWIPAVIWLFARGDTLSAALVTAWCAGVVGSIDNLLRPRLVGSDAKMSDLLILLSTLGGISLFGAVGFVVGPIVAAVFVTIWEVYGRFFASVLPATGASDAKAP
jgi:predicted PurR-regulated permease PerM